MKTFTCTIVARNYLAHAITLGQTLRDNSPGIDFYILVLDANAGAVESLLRETIDDLPPVNIVDAEALGVSSFLEMASRYSVLELSTAIKPFFLTWLLDRGYDRGLYLDPDIWVMAEMTEVLRALEDHTIALTPHLLTPLPEDGKKPDNMTILRAGAYNLGFLGLAATGEIRRFLDWWGEVLREECIMDPERGYHVDQKWMDLALGFLPRVYVCRSPAYNVAYWNLHERELAIAGQQFYVNGQPLVFFHFSGFNPNTVERLSFHQDRYKVRPGRPLHRLLHAYAARLKQNGFSTFSRLAYGLDSVDDAAPADPDTRLWHRERGKNFGDPMATGLASRSYRWMKSSADGTLVPGDYGTEVWRGQPELRRALAQPMDKGSGYLEEWSMAEGSRKTDLIDDSVRGENPPHAIRTPVRLPIVVTGYLNRVLGQGQVARSLIDALRRTGLDVASQTFDVGAENHPLLPGGWVDARPRPPIEAVPRINIVVINADQIERFEATVGPGFFRGAYNVGVWFWELPTFPEEWADAANQFDEIWVGSSFAQQAVAECVRKPVLTVPLPVQLPDGSAQAYDRRHFRISLERFVFLFTFDLFSFFERKNPLTLITAFQKAFGDDDAVELILKCVNSRGDPRNMACLRGAVRSAKNVRIMDAPLSGDEYAGLVRCCDCFVSLHRSEGFGLTMAEAMALKKPVIATGWSGNLTFMTFDNSFLVSYTLRRLEQDFGPYKAGNVWAEPDVDHAVQLMREVRSHPDRAQAVAARGAQTIRDFFSVEAVGRRITSRLATVTAGKALMASQNRTGVLSSARDNQDEFSRRVSLIDLRKARLAPKGLKRAGQRFIRKSISWLVQPPLDQTRAAILDLRARLWQVENQDSRPLAYRNPVPPRFDPKETVYRSFERIFRGTPELLQTRYPRYLNRLPRDGLILDVGCGTGDLLAWLQQKGLRVEGVDLDSSNVTEAQNRGLKVSEADGVDHLTRHPLRYSGIISVQVVEHLEAKRLSDFLAAAWSALVPGGVLVTETVNPYNPHQFRLFWLDPTHTRPIYPELLEFYLHRLGFERVETEFLPCFNESRREVELESPWDFCDYLVMALKPQSSS